MAVRCFQPLLGKRIRVTRLDACGNVPAPGTAESTVVTDGFISVTLSSEVEEGTEIITRKADGSLCVNTKTSDSFKRFTLEIVLCGVNPALLSLLSNAEPYQNYAQDDAGATVAEGALDKRFAFELWTGLSGSACEEGAEEASGYVLLPFVIAGVIGDLTVDAENSIDFTVTGAATVGGNNWGVGPYNVMIDPDAVPDPAPAPLPTPLDPDDHFLIVETGLAPPASACAFAAMPAAP